MRLSRSSCLRNSSWLRPPKVCAFKLSTCSNISRSSSSRISSRLRPAITHAALRDHGLVVLLVYQVVQSAQTSLHCVWVHEVCALTNPTQWQL